MNRLQAALVVSGLQALLLGPIGTATAQEKSVPKESTPKESPAAVAGPYLGIGIEAVHPAFHEQLPGSLIDGQGIMVSSVLKGSPADKAGLRRHDILTAFNDQRLFSGEQLIKLVRADKPGQEIKLQFVRGGKLETVAVTLGEEPAHIARRDHQQRDLWERRFPWAPLSPLLPDWQRPRTKTRNHWENFDSLSLKKLDANRFRAEISCFDKDGKTRKHTFEGTREELRKQIESEKDLSEDERDQMLDGLDLHSQFQFPAFPDAPFASPLAWPDPFSDF